MSNKLTEEDRKRILLLKKYYDDIKISNEQFFNNWQFEKDNSDVADYFNSYLNSEGFERILNNQTEWWKKRHPYRKLYSDADKGTRRWFEVAKKVEPYRYTSNFPRDNYVYTVNLPQRIMMTGRNDDKIKNYFYLGHEYFHGKNPHSIGRQTPFNSRSAQYEALKQNQNTEKNNHDEYSYEKNADIWGLKYLLYKEGIYDSRSNKDITIDEIKKLREKYPDLRPLQQMNDEQLMFMLNNVAMNNDGSMSALNNYYT